MSTCVVYFSKVGNTKIAAEHLAKKLNAKLIRLEDDTKYKGLVGFIKGGMNASKEKKATIDPKVIKEIEGFSRIILATPIWAGKTTPAINAVLENTDFTGKKVIVMTTQADPKFKGSDEKRAFYKEIIESKKGEFVDYYPLVGTPPGVKARSKEFMEDQVDKVIKIEA